MELFSSGEARWLGIQVGTEAEQPRILLVSVPYALKAAEAEMLGGRTVDEFVLNEELEKQVQQEVETQIEESTTTLVVSGGIKEITEAASSGHGQYLHHRNTGGADRSNRNGRVGRAGSSGTDGQLAGMAG